MTTYVSANEAARLLGVTKPTLYAYVSRGIVERSTAGDGRTSLYPREAIERLANRARTRRDTSRATIDVEIESGITELRDEGPRYRGHDVADLASDCSFEQVAELLWTGTLPEPGLQWTVDRTALALCRNVDAAAGATEAYTRLALAATALSAGGDDRVSDPGPITRDRSHHEGAAAARRLLAIAPSLLGGPVSGDVASRLAASHRRRPDPALVATVSRALVLLADHELATSTLAVRVACSVRTDPYAALAVGLDVVGGALHGVASTHVAELLDTVVATGAEAAVDGVLSSGRRLPGFGHSVYRNGDPRLPPLLESVRRLPGAEGRIEAVDSLLAAAGRRLGQLPNIDLGLGALTFVADLPRDGSLFAVARIAGWAAHYDEEIGERPVRYRGVTSYRGSASESAGSDPV